MTAARSGAECGDIGYLSVGNVVLSVRIVRPSISMHCANDPSVSMVISKYCDKSGTMAILDIMGEYKEVFKPTDLVLVVWPRQSELAIRRGQEVSRQVAASGAWAMDQNKADRVRVIISVHEDVIVGVWAALSNTNRLEAPAGKSRRVNRVSFDTREDSRLNYLIGQPSPLRPRRNPQATMELRDLNGYQVLVSQIEENPHHGVVQVGGFVLTVLPDGTADLVTPPGVSVTVRPVG